MAKTSPGESLSLRIFSNHSKGSSTLLILNTESFLVATLSISQSGTRLHTFHFVFFFLFAPQRFFARSIEILELINKSPPTDLRLGALSSAKELINKSPPTDLRLGALRSAEE